MASIATARNGSRSIQFTAPDGQRHTLTLGKVSLHAAELVKGHAEKIISSLTTGDTMPMHTAQWVASLPDKMHTRLVRQGLASPRGAAAAAVTLGTMLDRWTSSMDTKPATVVFYGHTLRNLKEFYGEGRAVASIGVSEADSFRTWLTKEESLSPATVGRRIKACRTIWAAAVRWAMIVDNPFKHVRGGTQSNPARKHFVTREAIDRILDVTTDLEMRAIIALARYGGLRTPSEAFAMKWADVDFARRTIRVPCPKLEHLGPRFASRVIPLFRELHKPLLDLFTVTIAEPGVEHVIAKHRKGSANLRTQFHRLAARASVPLWPRTFHAMRASRQSELEREYGRATACRWLGNSEAVAEEHYIMPTDLGGDFAKATGWDEAPEGAANSCASAPQNPTLQGTTLSERNGRESSQDLEPAEVLPLAAAYGALPNKDLLGPRGPEHPQDSRAKTAIGETGAAKSYASQAFSAQVQAILNLPLADSEKAEAVRRLLGEQAGR